MGNQQSLDPNVIPDYVSEHLEEDLSVKENRSKCMQAVAGSGNFLALQAFLSKLTQDQINDSKLYLLVLNAEDETHVNCVKYVISKYTRPLGSDEVRRLMRKAVNNIHLMLYVLNELSLQVYHSSYLEDTYINAARYGKGTLKLLVDRYGYQFHDQIKKVAMERRNKDSLKLILSHSTAENFTLEELLYVDDHELIFNRLTTSTPQEVSKALVSILEVTERSHTLTMIASPSNKEGISLNIKQTQVTKGDINSEYRYIIDLLLPKADLSYNNYRIVELIANRGLYWQLETILPLLDFTLCWDQLFTGVADYHGCRKCFDMVMADPRSNVMYITNSTLEIIDMDRLKEVVDKYGITEEQKAQLEKYHGAKYEKILQLE